MYGIGRVMRGMMLAVLCAGGPYGPLLPHHPSSLHYRRWYGRWTPERSSR